MYFWWAVKKKCIFSWTFSFAKSDEKGAAAGGEMYIKDDIEIYQLTEAGIALQATVAGTYFREYTELN